MKYHLPKKYLSYSAINLWNTNKENFRKRYYLDQKFFDTPYTLFGREVHSLLEKGDPRLKHIPRYPVKELKVKTEVEGIPVLGYIDAVNLETKSFLDYKTSLKPWTRVRVETLDQLPFYSMLIKQEYGEVNDECALVWLETRKTASSGLLSTGDRITLTGRHETFFRVISEEQRDYIKEWILKAAEEISNDFCAWKKEHERVSSSARMVGALLK